MVTFNFLHLITSHCISLHLVTFNFPHLATSHCISLHLVTFNFLHLATSHCISLHLVTFNFLHLATSHCISLHLVTFNSLHLTTSHYSLLCQGRRNCVTLRRTPRFGWSQAQLTSRMNDSLRAFSLAGHDFTVGEAVVSLMSVCRILAVISCFIRFMWHPAVQGRIACHAPSQDASLWGRGSRGVWKCWSFLFVEHVDPVAGFRLKITDPGLLGVYGISILIWKPLLCPMRPIKKSQLHGSNVCDTWVLHGTTSNGLDWCYTSSECSCSLCYWRDDGSHAFVIGAQAICPTLLSTSCSHRSKSRAYSYTFLILVHHTLFSAQSPEASDTSEPGCPQQKLKEQWETIRSVLDNRASDLANAQVTCVNCWVFDDRVVYSCLIAHWASDCWDWERNLM